MKTYKIVRRNPDTLEGEEIVAHRCACGNFVECCIDGEDNHWIHCTCGKTTKCGVGVMEQEEDRAEFAIACEDHGNGLSIVHDDNGACQGDLEYALRCQRERLEFDGLETEIVKITPLEDTP